MKAILKLEELAMLGLSVYLFSLLRFQWWWFAVLFLAPDIGFLGYIINSHVGSMTYNLLHHKGIAILLYVLGMLTDSEVVKLIGVVMFGHASFDRILGYGLKYADSFNHTHLGMIGKKKEQ